MTSEQRQWVKQQINQALAQRLNLRQDGILHGTDYGYKRQGCRCDGCRKGEADRRRDRRRRNQGLTNNRDKTHCPAGHPYDDVNTYICPRGHRECRRCRNERRQAA